jgi:tetratricopeptide (TPR) repeat protein
VAKYPEDRELAALLGEALLALKKYDESATVLAAEAAKYPNSSRLHLNLARALLRGGHADEAAPHFRSAVTFEPGPEMWIAVASTLAEAGSDLAYADTLSSQAMTTIEGMSAGWTASDAVDPKNRRTLSFLVQSWRASGWTAFRRGDLDTARARLEAAMATSLSADDAYRLAQIDEARKDVAAATLEYGLASIWSRPPNAVINARLAELVPVAADRDALLRRAEQRRRELAGHPLARETRDQAQTGFAVVVDASGVVREAAIDRYDVRQIGDVDAVVKLLVGMDVGPKIPWNSDARTLRRGRIDCAFERPVCGVSMFTPQPVLEGQ